MGPNKKIDIGEVYRDAFRDYSREPSPGVWEALEQQAVAHTPAGGSPWLSPAGWIIGAAGVGIITATLIFLNPKGNDADDASIPETNQPLIQDTPRPAEAAPVPENGAPYQERSPEAAKPALSNAQYSPKRHQLKTASSIATTDGISGQPGSEGESAASSLTPDMMPAKQPAIETEASTSNPPASIPVKNNGTPPAGSTLVNTATKGFNLSISPDQSICSGEKIRIGASGANVYYWSTGEMTDSIEVTPESSNAYRVTAYNNEGLYRIAEVIVSVRECAEVFIPNTFTPNFDGINDEFIALGKGLIEFQMIITDKSGFVVFESNDINRGWDGSYRGQAMETGNYFYQVSYLDANRQSFQRRGRLILLR
jgi:gliding motility-associated-like protein